MAVAMLTVTAFSVMVPADDSEAALPGGKKLYRNLWDHHPKDVTYTQVIGDDIEIVKGKTEEWNGGNWWGMHYRFYQIITHRTKTMPDGSTQQIPLPFPSWASVSSSAITGTANATGSFEVKWERIHQNTGALVGGWDVEDSGKFTIKIVDRVKVKLQYPSQVANREGRDSVTLPIQEIHGDRVLVGWNTKADFSGTFYKAGSKITTRGTTTLYAQWEPVITHTSALEHDTVHNGTINVAVNAKPTTAIVTIVTNNNPLDLKIVDGRIKGTLSNATPGLYKTLVKIETPHQTKNVEFKFYVLPYASVTVTDTVTLGTSWNYVQSMNPNTAQFRLMPIEFKRTDTSEILDIALVKANGNSMSVRFDAAGNYQIDYRMEAINNPDLKTIYLSKKVQVVPPPPPTYPPSAEGMTVLPTQNVGEYDFSVRNPANYKEIHWEFGDGTTSSTLTPTHVYILPGVYNVKLTLTATKAEFSDYSVTEQVVYFEEKNPPESAFLTAPIIWMTEVTSSDWTFNNGGATWLSTEPYTVGAKKFFRLTGTCPDDISLVGKKYNVSLVDGDRTREWTITVYSTTTVQQPDARFSHSVEGMKVTVNYLGDEWGIPWIDWGESNVQSFSKMAAPTITHTYLTPGWYTISAYVEANGLKTPRSWLVQVSDAPPVSSEPLRILKPADLKVAPGGEISFNVISVPLGATITIEGPEWLKIDGYTISGTVPEDASGVVTVKVTATLGEETAETSFLVTLEGAKTIPKGVPIALGAVGIVMLIATLVTRSPRMLLLTVVVLAAIGGAFLI